MARRHFQSSGRKYRYRDKNFPEILSQCRFCSSYCGLEIFHSHPCRYKKLAIQVMRQYNGNISFKAVLSLMVPSRQLCRRKSLSQMFNGIVILPLMILLSGKIFVGVVVGIYGGEKFFQKTKLPQSKPVEEYFNPLETDQ